ncbi:sugar phosphate isomerase/epimerase [Novosphingobium sp. TH158]|uniref:sugar phosphate isomerase/epimerase family protein n=1 Tax=Novosphingobium sp. TH158 TaxID=2067455 RepID=UPI000C7980BC|nr:sugar phosphate isomerase/epimerase [Novosphingobium sp. TH158]PLK27808.1 sugar phosphate isomerase/epimerase [Novosphingobium sp. TH158]
MLGGSALAAGKRSFFDRIGKPIGLQIYTLGDEPAKDLDGVLAKLASIGYRDLELPSLLGRKPAELKAAADRAGLRFSAIHLPLQGMPGGSGFSMLSEPQRIADDLGALGIFQGVAPIAPFPPNFRPQQGETMQAAIGRSFAAAGKAHWQKAAAVLNERAAALRPFGILVGYHNHNIEFAPVEGTTGWDILAAETDPGLVHFEVDVGWIVAAGLDPVAFFRKHAGRCRWMHVKDVKASTKTNFHLSMEPTEVGSGKMDWARVLPAARAAGVEHFYVEQEPPFAIPRMEAAAKGFAFLSKLRA